LHVGRHVGVRFVPSRLVLPKFGHVCAHAVCRWFVCSRHRFFCVYSVSRGPILRRAGSVCHHTLSWWPFLPHWCHCRHAVCGGYVRPGHGLFRVFDRPRRTFCLKQWPMGGDDVPGRFHLPRGGPVSVDAVHPGYLRANDRGHRVHRHQCRILCSHDGTRGPECMPCHNVRQRSWFVGVFPLPCGPILWVVCIGRGYRMPTGFVRPDHGSFGVPDLPHRRILWDCRRSIRVFPVCRRHL